MRYLYSLFISCYGFGILIASLFNKKATLWIEGRKNIFRQIDEKIDKNAEIIWFHAASLGEFEQGRPVIESFKIKYPQYKILLTFFSPSGFEIRKNYSHADYIFYLPLDTSANARKFLTLVQPQQVFFIKYEFWFNFLKELKNNNVPVYIISAIFRPQQHFFKWYGSWFRKQLTAFSHFFVQNQTSLQLLQSIQVTNVSISGDTRFDRVCAIAENPSKFPIIDYFVQDKKVLVVGSSWEKDEEILSNCLEKNDLNCKLIIAPHEIHKSHITSLKTLFPNSICYSEAVESTIAGYDILIIDNVGMLSSLYTYATVAYIGGGFGKGIHNILEAAVYGIPVCFGPQYKKFQEAVDLIVLKGVFCIHNSDTLAKQLHLFFNNTAYYKKTADICTKYITKNKGATGIIINNLQI